MRLKSFLLLAGTAFVLAGCVSVDYTGEEFPETQYVKLFFDKRFVSSKVYQQIGSATLTAQEGASSSEIDQKLIEKGKSVGADAILIAKKQVINEGPLDTEGGTNDQPVVPEANVMGLQPDGALDQTDSFGDVQTSPRVSTYETETVINAVFFKKKTAIHKIQEEDKARAEGLEFDKKKVYVNKKEQEELAKKYKIEHPGEKACGEETESAGKARELTSLKTQDELNKTSQTDKKIINSKDKDKLIVNSLKSQEDSTKAPEESPNQKNFDKEFNPENKNDPIYEKYKKALNKKDSTSATLASPKAAAQKKDEKAAKTETKQLDAAKDLKIKPPQDEEIEKILNEIKKETKKEQNSDGKQQSDDDTIK